jgi:Zn-finger nucleic acid-binding protein
MNCPSCGAPMKLKPDMDSFKCEYCQSVYFPEKDDDGVRVLGEPSGQSCPICNVALMQASIDKFRIVYCTKCRGMLIPMEEFQVLVDDLQALQRDTIVQSAADSSDLRRKIGCPRCHHPMDTHFYAGPGNVVIDSCDLCELNWLDHGELMRIVHAPDDHSPETFVASASAYGDEMAGAAPYDPAQELQGSSRSTSGTVLFDAIVSLFRR